jgi:hypothetical protein
MCKVLSPSFNRKEHRSDFLKYEIINKLKFIMLKKNNSKLASLTNYRSDQKVKYKWRSNIPSVVLINSYFRSSPYPDAFWAKSGCFYVNKLERRNVTDKKNVARLDIMEQIRSWETNSRSADQELSRLHYRVLKRTPLVPILSQLNPVSFKIHLPSHLCLSLPSGLFHSGLPIEILCEFLVLSHAYYMHRQSHPPLFDNTNDIW